MQAAVAGLLITGLNAGSVCKQTQNTGPCIAASPPTCANVCIETTYDPENRSEWCIVEDPNDCGWTDCTQSQREVNSYSQQYTVQGYFDPQGNWICTGCGLPLRGPKFGPFPTGQMCDQASIPPSADTCCNE